MTRFTLFVSVSLQTLVVLTQCIASPTTSQALGCTPLDVGADGIPASFQVDSTTVTVPDDAVLLASIISSDIGETTPIAGGVLEAATADNELPNDIATYGLTSVLEAGKTYQLVCAGAYYSSDGSGLVTFQNSTTSFTYQP